MTSQTTPIQLLVDALASKKQITRILKKRVESTLIDLLSQGVERTTARIRLRSAMERFLDNRGFARFNRKKTLDRLIARAFKKEGYNLHLRDIKIEDGINAYKRINGCEAGEWTRSTLRYQVSQEIWMKAKAI